MRLFHFTTEENAERIRADGQIRPTWPRELSAAWPDRMVWLTVEPSADKQGWKASENPRVRFSVNLPDADVVPWSDYRMSKPPENVSGLETAARVWSEGDPACWHLVFRAIPYDEWTDDGVIQGSQRA